jgi:hypothetical protein
LRHGQTEDIADHIETHCDSMAEAFTAFRDLVADYLTTCAAGGEAPAEAAEIPVKNRNDMIRF